MSLKLYLCGSVTGRSTKEMREERESATKAIQAQGWTAIDPLAGEYDELKRRRNIQDDQSGLSFATIALKDKYAIENSDMLIWLTADVASYGSCIEVGLAWARGIPIISIDREKRGRKNAFVGHISTYIADSLDEALEFIERYMVMPQLSWEAIAELDKARADNNSI